MQFLVKDAAKLFNVSEKTIYRWIAEAGLPAIRINKQYRFNKVELLEWATSHKVNVSPPSVAYAGAAGPLPPLSEALQAGGVHYRVGGMDKESVLREVVSLLRMPDSMDREFLLRILLEREAMGSTAIGDGIAIPHVRNPIVLKVSRPAITLCFLEQPIDFHAIDGKPVGILFTLISPTIREHLHVLSSLAFALHDAAFKDVVLRQGSRDEILSAARQVESSLAPLRDQREED
ncbi:MAG TPA: PTS sugar transporter subunit IIA [Candidatus Hydrogenedentes bacterium]|nr:PTS sugar transporter subunit IIA [Candidatus Hydrogenedentota bacterium]HOS03476.1 PTS sugar transporter subunit IIA [Candidatus Hydrogenedentota bacterium]